MKGQGEHKSDYCLPSSLQGDHVWLNPPSASKTSVAIGGIIKETKPGKILVEDDEGKVSVARLSSWPLPLPRNTTGCQALEEEGHL